MRRKEAEMYLHIDPDGLKTIHRHVMAERRGRNTGWLRWAMDIDN